MYNNNNNNNNILLLLLLLLLLYSYNSTHTLIGCFLVMISHYFLV